jgi:hypothetical protein
MWVSALWGLLGGLAVEAVEVMHDAYWKNPPWKKYGHIVYLLRIVIRMGLGACLSSALASSHEISNSLMALMSGASAPLFLEKALKSSGVTSSINEGPQEKRSDIASGATPNRIAAPSYAVQDEGGNAF